MKLIPVFLKNIKDLLPYLLLIAIYFVFVNIEAKNQKKTTIIKEVFEQSENQPNAEVNSSRIKIPVIPYKE